MLGLSITTIIILILLFFVFFKITKIIWKAILFSLLVLLVFLVGFGYLVYADINKIINEEKTILVSTEEEIISGLIFTKEIEEAIYLDEEIIEDYSEKLKEGNRKAVLNESYLLIILKTEIFDEMGDTIEVLSEPVPKEDALSALSAETPEEFMEIANRISENITESDSITREEMLKYKFQISGVLAQNMLEEKGGAKKIVKDMEFYPNRISLVILKEMPNLIENLIPDEI